MFDLHSSADEYPWVITIHLKKFPENLVRFANRDEKRNCFLQAIKEADQLKNKGRVVSEMKPDEHNKLFDSLCNSEFILFYLEYFMHKLTCFILRKVWRFSVYECQIETGR